MFTIMQEVERLWEQSMPQITGASFLEPKRGIGDESPQMLHLVVPFSHLLSVPQMNGMIGMTNLLLSTDLDPQQLDYVKTAHASGNALVQIVSDVLDLSRIEAGKMDLEEVIFDVRAEVRSCPLFGFCGLGNHSCNLRDRTGRIVSAARRKRRFFLRLLEASVPQ